MDEQGKKSGQKRGVNDDANDVFHKRTLAKKEWKIDTAGAQERQKIPRADKRLH
jgi:hypothetical protein